MANRPLSAPLPADLPEDWTDGQIVAPSGASAGLSEQHGYNYLMEMVNRAQEAVNTINEGFDDISGRRTCRFVVGTSTAGWTQADCDYLCDGTDDQVELNAAVEATLEKGGGEITILAGEYQLSGVWNIEGSEDITLSFIGEPGETVLNLSNDCEIHHVSNDGFAIQFSGITFRGGETIWQIRISSVYASFWNCIFVNVLLSAINSIGGRFLFKENTVELTGTTNRVLSFFVNAGQKGNCLVDGNTFLVRSYPGGSGIIQIQGADRDCPGPIFTNNTVISSVSENRNMCIQAMGFGCVGSNRVIGASVIIDAASICFGNQVANGSIRADYSGVVAGNVIQNGNIYATGYTSVVGNVVSAPMEGDALETAAIGLQKSGGNDIPPQHTPIVTGNIITSGKVGIHLQFLDTPTISQNVEKTLISGNRISGCTTSIQIESNWSGCMVTGNVIDTPVVDNGTGNIVRLNSNDTGGGGGGTAGVSSFKGRTGAVVPASGDYTAAMVGAVPSGDVAAVQAVTQAEYDALTQKDPATLYLIAE